MMRKRSIGASESAAIPRAPRASLPRREKIVVDALDEEDFYRRVL